MRLGDLSLPDTPACSAALEVTTAYSSPALVNHCLRASVWAAAFGELRNLPFDAELLFVAAMLHDISLTPEFDNHTIAFEVAGGHVGWVFAAGAGWPAGRRGRVAEVIEKHMWAEVDPGEDPEGFLLSRATGVDITGRHAEELPAGFRDEVLARHPRLTLTEEFLRCFGDQADRKPDSAAAAAMRNDLPARMARNPLEQP